MDLGLGGWTAISIVGLIVGIWLYWHRNAPRVTTLLWLNGGAVIGGIAGSFAGAGLAAALGVVGGAVENWLGLAISSVVAGVALVVTLEVIVKGILPFRRLKPKPARFHPPLALILPIIVGVAGFPLLTTVVNAFTLVNV